jgi:hypothetical protein
MYNRNRAKAPKGSILLVALVAIDQGWAGERERLASKSTTAYWQRPI